MIVMSSEGKKYTLIVFDDRDKDVSDPWKRRLVEVNYGDSLAEFVDPLNQYCPYILYDNRNGNQIGHGIIDTDLERDINVIEDRKYVIVDDKNISQSDSIFYVCLDAIRFATEKSKKDQVNVKIKESVNGVFTDRCGIITYNGDGSLSLDIRDLLPM